MIVDRIVLSEGKGSAPTQAKGILLMVVNATNGLYDAVEAQALIDLWAHGEVLNLAERFWIHDQSVQMIRTLSREPVGWITQTSRDRFRSMTGSDLPLQIFFELSVSYGFFARAPITPLGAQRTSGQTILLP